MGYSRVGCIGCPIAGTKWRWKEFSDFPTYKNAYIRAFEQMILVRKAKEKATQWQTGRDVFDWWMGVDTIPGQIRIEDILEKE